MYICTYIYTFLPSAFHCHKKAGGFAEVGQSIRACTSYCGSCRAEGGPVLLGIQAQIFSKSQSRYEVHYMGRMISLSELLGLGLVQECFHLKKF